MAGRQGTTFQKRQKEAKRREKRRMKEERRSARKAEKAQMKAVLSPDAVEPREEFDDAAEPEEAQAESEPESRADFLTPGN